MGIGVGVFLVVLGAIFKFAITAHLSGVDLQAIGVILMIAGIAVVLLNLVFLSRRRPTARSREGDRGPFDEKRPPTG